MNLLSNFLGKSINILIYHGAGCGCCAMEASVCFSRQLNDGGIRITGNPKHADVLLVTGCINGKCRTVVENLYNQMGSPKAVVAVGACACSGGMFHSKEKNISGLEEVIPVNAFVRGCSPLKENIIMGVGQAIEKLVESEHKKTPKEKEDSI